jgi:acetyl esterase
MESHVVPGLLHPALRALLKGATAGAPSTPPSSMSEVRKAFAEELARLDVPGPEMREVEDRLVPVPGSEVPIRLYYPTTLPARAEAPCLIFFHGGGWSMGSIETHDSLARGLAHWGACVVANVGYRLAPEHPFPTPLNDCVIAVEWLRKNAGSCGVDLDRLGLGGDSAGGNLASGVLQKLGSRVPRFEFLLLIYPVTDIRATTESRRLFDKGYWVDSLPQVITQYLPREADRDDPLVSPLRASAHHRWPATRIVIAGFDPLRDEGRMLSDRLLSAGVPCELICYPQFIHGFLSLPAILPESRDVLAETGWAIRRALRK